MTTLKIDPDIDKHVAMLEKELSVLRDKNADLENKILDLIKNHGRISPTELSNLGIVLR